MSSFIKETLKELSSIAIPPKQGMPQFTPVHSPGLSLFPEFCAQKSEHFIMKKTYTHWTRQNFTICYATPAGGSSERKFLEIDEVKSDRFAFKDMNGKEVMRIVKEDHLLKPCVYHGMDPSGTERWTLSLKRHLLDGTEYLLTLHTASHSEIQITIRNGVGGQEKSAFYNGVMVAGTSRSGEWKHLRRQDHVYVAPGFDVLVAIGIAFVRVDKQTDDDDMDDFGII